MAYINIPGAQKFRIRLEEVIPHFEYFTVEELKPI